MVPFLPYMVWIINQSSFSDEEAQKQAITEMKEKFEENDEIPVVAVPNEPKVAATSEDLSGPFLKYLSRKDLESSK